MIYGHSFINPRARTRDFLAYQILRRKKLLAKVLIEH